MNSNVLNNSVQQDAYSIYPNDGRMVDCFSNFPDVIYDNPILVDFKTIQMEQAWDAGLLHQLQT